MTAERLAAMLDLPLFQVREALESLERKGLVTKTTESKHNESK